MTPLLDRIGSPADVRALAAGDLAPLCAEIREVLVQTAIDTGQGHLGPNLGVVELTIALHRVFDSPSEPILFDVGHQAYVHKLLTGRVGQFDTMRQRGGLSGYPNRAESPHDWIENSHASTALSYADGIAKAFALRQQRQPVVAVVGDGALTGGMCWEALNNIAAGEYPVVIVVNDNGRSYAPTTGGLARRLAALRLRPGYERVLGGVKGTLPRVPVIGAPLYDALHGMKRGVKDLLAPQGMFEDLGLKYLGPVDGHDLAALERALVLARHFDGPVVVHCVTQKGHGYAPAENDEADQLHQWRPVDAATGRIIPSSKRSWTSAFSDELVALGKQREDLVAITAAMAEPTGLSAFANTFPERCYDVGIAEQHAVTCAAGLATAGMRPVVALYATFLNRAFDQLLMDVALHQLPVTVMLHRAGVTGQDGPSHHGMWDLAVLGVVPGLHIAAPRDEASLCRELDESVELPGPSVLRVPKTPLPAPMPALRSVGRAEVLAEPATGAVDVLIVSVGAVADLALEAAATVTAEGYRAQVVDPCWVTPVDEALVELAAAARLVVTVEDGVAVGGAGSRLAAAIAAAGVDVPVRSIGLPTEFLDHGTPAEVRAAIGLTAPDIARRVIDWAACLPATTRVEPVAQARQAVSE